MWVLRRHRALSGLRWHGSQERPDLWGLPGFGHLLELQRERHQVTTTDPNGTGGGEDIDDAGSSEDAQPDLGEGGPNLSHGFHTTLSNLTHPTPTP